jgi:RimJ/RimL family protein N-acetyltransferase
MDGVKKHADGEASADTIANMDIGSGALRLDAVREDELPLLLPLFNEPEAAGFYVPTMVRPYNLEQLRGMLADWNDRSESYLFAVRHLDKLVGIVNIDGFSWANAHAEIGIALTGPGYRGHGFASGALRILLDYLFREVGLHRVYCRIMAGNEASMHLFLRLGFHEEGIMRSHIRRKGAYLDMHLFGMLSEEWNVSPEGFADA